MSPLNPAIALGAIFQQAYHLKADVFFRFYVYIPFPLLGGILAVLFHEFVYKRISESIQESEDHDGILDDGRGEEDVLGIQKDSLNA